MLNNINTMEETQQQGLPRSQFEELKFLITNLGDRINNRIDTLEVKITADINDLKHEDRRLSNLIDTNKEATEREITDLKNRLVIQEEENRRLRDTKEEGDLLAAKVIELEKSSYNSQQHQRGWNVEIDGIPVNIGDEPEQLEKAAIELFSAINVQIRPSAIDTIHRLPSSRNEPKPVIIRFKSRKDVREIHENKAKLRYLSNLNLNMSGLDEESRIYIRPSQCSYFKNLSYNCRLLKRNGMIERVKVANDGKVTIKTLDGTFLKVSHQSDLTSKFTRFERFSFNVDHGVQ